MTWVAKIDRDCALSLRRLVFKKVFTLNWVIKRSIPLIRYVI